MTDEQTEALKRFNDEQAKIVAEYVQKSNIAELENLKAEIKVNAYGEYDFEGYCREEKISIKEVNKIIDNHIKELKGE